MLEDFTSFIELAAGINLIFSFWNYLKRKILNIYTLLIEVAIDRKLAQWLEVQTILSDWMARNGQAELEKSKTLVAGSMIKIERFKDSRFPEAIKAVKSFVYLARAFSFCTVIYCIILLWMAAEGFKFSIWFSENHLAAFLLYAHFVLFLILVALYTNFKILRPLLNLLNEHRQNIEDLRRVYKGSQDEMDTIMTQIAALSSKRMGKKK